MLLGLCFPLFGMGYIAVFALVPLMAAIHFPGSGKNGAAGFRGGFRLGFIAGAAFFLVLLHWIPRLPPENLTIPYAMYPVFGLMVLYLSLYPALAGGVSGWLARRGVPLALVFPAAWTLIEVFKGTGLLGFPWGALGYAMAEFPHLIQFASWVGLWGVTLWLAALNALLYGFLDLAWGRPKVLALIALVLGLGLPYLHGTMVLRGRVVDSGQMVGLVQPNIGNDKWDRAVRDSIVQVLLDQTEMLVRESSEPPAMVVWPETAIPARLPREAYYRYRVLSLVDRIGVPLLAGYPDGVLQTDGSYRFTNSAGLVLPDSGMVQTYDKRHLVPFSEHFPLPVLNRYDFGQSNFSAGTRTGIFDGTGTRFGVLICFESIFPGPSRELAASGAKYLVNITNDQWFGDSAAPWQHFAMNVFRAIENRISVARAANTGISGVIDPYGLVRERSTTFMQQRLVVPVEFGPGGTVYTRFGDWILGVPILALTLSTVAAVRRRRPAETG